MAQERFGVRGGLLVCGHSVATCHIKQHILVVRNRLYNADSGLAVRFPHCHTSYPVIGRVVLTTTVRRAWNEPRAARGDWTSLRTDLPHLLCCVAPWLSPVACDLRWPRRACACANTQEPMTIKRDRAFETWRAAADAINAVVPDMARAANSNQRKLASRPAQASALNATDQSRVTLSLRWEHLRAAC